MARKLLMACAGRKYRGMKLKIYIFGAGTNGLQLLNHIKSIDLLLQNLYKGGGIEAFIDNDISKQGKIIDGLRCISLDEAIRDGAQNDLIIISVYQSAEIEEQLEKYGFKNIICLGKWLGSSARLKNFIPVFNEKVNYKYLVPFENYESPYPDILEICQKEMELFDREKKILDIDLNLGKQLELIKEMGNIEKPKFPFQKNNQYRYYYNNPWFEMADANALYYMLRIIRPNNVIEVGSGFSTAAMLDINENYFCNNIQITSIEPDSLRLKRQLKDSDCIKIYERKLQQMPLSFFEILGENDLLFIDSSHISKFNSDVNYLFFEVLPRLRKGVYIHFHDIQYPFIYPKEWIYEGRAYSEMYLLRAFLMNNKEYSVQFWCDMLQWKFKDNLIDSLLGSPASSIYIKKCV